MILPVEAAGLAIRGLSPQLKSLLSAYADNRPCIVQRATYQAFGANLQSILMGYTFPRLTLVGGRQIRMVAYGVARNAGGGAPETFLPAVRITQNGPTQAIGAITTLAATGTDVAWRVDVDLAISIVGASGQSTPQPGSNQVVLTGGAINSGNQPAEAFMVGGTLRCFLTNNGLTSGLVAGGPITTGALPSSFMIGTDDPNQNIYQNTIPTLITLELTTGADIAPKLVGGYIEAL